jgi:cytochrome c553
MTKRNEATTAAGLLNSSAKYKARRRAARAASFGTLLLIYPIERKVGKAMRLIIERTKKVLAVTAIACIAALVSAGSSPGISAAPADAAASYKSKCASCHGGNGSGQTAVGKTMKLRDLRSAEVQALSDAQLLSVISKGKGKMPGYEKSLGAETCKALVAHIRQLK